MLVGIFLWWLIGFLGITLFILRSDTSMTKDILTVDEIDLVVGALFGLVIILFLVITYLHTDQRLKWEPKIIFKN